MASNGSFLTNGWYSDSKKDYVYLEFAWEVSSTSIAQNSTTIYWELRGKRTASGFINAGGFKVVIDGATVYEKSTDYRIELYNGTVVASGTYTLYHDGTGKRSFGVSAQGALYYYAVNCTGSGAWELPSIPRQATLTSATDFTDEQNPTITYSNPAGSAVTALDACISLDGARDDIVYRPVPTGGGSYTFALTEAERNVLRSATASSNSRTVHFYLRTNIGGTVFHSSVAKTLSIVNASPTLPSGSVSYEDVNSSVVAITGNNQHIVQNASSLRAVFGSATGNKGAWITGYTISVNGAVVTTQGSGYVDFGAVNSSQNVTLSVTARDSRGNTTTANKTVTMLAWSLPVFTASIERLNNYEDETYLTVDASVSSVNGKNTMAISYKYKLSGGSYGSAVQINNRTRYTISCDKENAYVFSITVADRLGSTTREIHLDKGKFPLFIDTQKNAVGVNAFPESGVALRVAGGVARFDDGIEVFSNGVKEWINPPMVFGEEYRTTERYNGSPVYTKLVDFGALTNWTFKTVQIGVSGDKIVDIIARFRWASGEEFAKDINYQGGGYWYLYDSAIVVRATSDLSHYVATFTVKYIK